MTRDQFARVLAWTPDDQDTYVHSHGAKAGVRALIKQPPAPWPEIMTAQRLAWHYGPAEAYLRLCGPQRRAA